jgi:VanZ family protein
MRIPRSLIIYQAPAIFFAIVLFIFSSISYPPDIKLFVTFDDLVKHTIAYCIFGFFIARALNNQTRYLKLRQKLFLFTFLIGTLYGISDEFHQYFVPGRSSEILDVVADSVGTILGFIVFHFWRNK